MSVLLRCLFQALNSFDCLLIDTLPTYTQLRYKNSKFCILKELKLHYLILSNQSKTKIYCRNSFN